MQTSDSGSNFFMQTVNKVSKVLFM